MRNNDEKIVGGLGIREEGNNERINFGFDKKQTSNYGGINTYTSIDEKNYAEPGINIPMGNSPQQPYINQEPIYYPNIKKRNKGLKFAIGIVSSAIILSSAFLFINNMNNSNGGTIIEDTTRGENAPIDDIDDVFDPKDPTIIDDPTKINTKLTSNERDSIENLFEQFYNEHIYAANHNYDGYVMDYLTENGSYRKEYKQLMENHAELEFELIELNILNISKKNNNTYMVTVKDKMYVDRPENLSIQTCKTVYEVRKIDNEYLIHSIKSETKIEDESKVLETKQTTEEVIEDYTTNEEPIYDYNVEDGNGSIDTYME